jgi:Transposase and inactivated derivatives
LKLLQGYLSAQVDWKENLKLISRNGEIFNVNIFLYVLGYSRMEYIQLTVDRTQETLFDCLNHAFEHLGGIPEEIWFDNMKTVVDHSKSQFGKAVFNESFRQYAKDAGFQPIACRPFRPQTKGKVEALARTMDRLKVFNKEFEDLSELQQIVKVFMNDLNHQEVSQATGVIPERRFREEQLNLKGFDGALLESYSSPSETLKRKVSKESMILFGGKKYSVPVRYIGHTVTLKKFEEQLEIYTEGKQVAVHRLSEQPYNYRREDYSEILKSDVLSHFDETELEAYVDDNLQAYDLL